MIRTALVLALVPACVTGTIDTPVSPIEEQSASCGDGVCVDESCATCPEDCGTCPTCGDGMCSPSEDCDACATDCGDCPGTCGDGTCDADEDCTVCATDCGTCPGCGDGTCDASEDCGSCAADCGTCPTTCGDGTCDANEDCATCSVDCGTCPGCGDGTCDASEDCGSCAADCGTCPTTCGDGTCDANEDCASCADDCGTCTSCGDGTCDPGETCSSCATDCGSCGDWPLEVPAPWNGWDVMPSSSDTFSNESGDFTVSCTGSPGNLAGLTASEVISGNDDKLTINASYCVIHDLQIEGYSVRLSGDHYVIRDSDIDGAGRTSKNGLSLSGNNGVAYRVASHHLLGNDRHCFTNGQGATDMWFIENEGYYCTGDGYQAGHQADGNRPTNIYLVRNHMYDNRENGLDYKYVENVWAVENVLHGFVSASANVTWCFPDDPTVCESNLTSGSDGSAVVIGSDGGPIDSYHYRNTIYDAGTAIRIEAGFGEVHLEGNVQYDVGKCLALDKDGMGIQYIGNECRNADRGIFQNWRVNFSLNVTGNTFEAISGPAIEYENGSVVDASTLTDNAFIGAGPVIYNNTTASTATEINALPGASGNTVGSSL